ncbi:ArsR/SmtB family transcription factor [Pseudophaeobacter sp.]|uniref:ArsR/SmtB family transcription factor n=1 Tax=Pseudophaeobacter sp. TaxID=1971739 RepID=UPI004058804D
MIDSNTIAATFSALAHPSRVDIFKCLLAHYPKGLNAGHLSAEVQLAPSTLSHHLREMEKGRLVQRCVAGQSTITSLDLSNLTEITSTLMQLCCSAEQAPERE